MGDSEYHIWEGSSVRIRLRRSVMEHINDEVMKGFTSVPKRGAEVGGILLGKAEDDGLTLIVEDFEPVPCEHRFGPSYHLSPADIQNLEETLDWFRADSHGNLSVLAFYRSHTRYGFFLSEEDEKLLAKYFAEPKTAILLIKPLRVQTSVADFFLRENDRLQEAAEPVRFPFGLPPFQTESWTVNEAGAAETAPRIEEPAAPQPPLTESPKEPLPVEPAPFVPPATLPLAAKRGTRNWIWAAVTTAMLVAVAILLYETLGHGSTASPQSVSVLGLRAVGDHERVRVFWNGNARTIQDAQRAILTISDGASRRDLSLTSEQLRRGALLYVPRDGSLTFRMNVYSRADTVSAESVRLQVSIPRAPADSAEKSDRQTRNRTAPESDIVRDEAEIRRFLEHWASSLRQGDAGAYAAHYAPALSVYFTRKNISRSMVRQSGEQMLQKYGPLDLYRISDIQIEPDGPARAQAVFRKRWQTSGGAKFAGEQRERLRLVKTDGQWRIVSEEELKLNWVYTDK